MPQVSDVKFERTNGPRGETATATLARGNIIDDQGNWMPRKTTARTFGWPANLNPSNRPVRTRMPGGVAGDAEVSPPRPYADQ